jgi:hypothetical protein
MKITALGVVTTSRTEPSPVEPLAAAAAGNAELGGSWGYAGFQSSSGGRAACSTVEFADLPGGTGQIGVIQL